jgi:hypothetical protein
MIGIENICCISTNEAFRERKNQGCAKYRSTFFSFILQWVLTFKDSFFVCMICVMAGDIVKYLFQEYGNGNNPSRGLLERSVW